LLLTGQAGEQNDLIALPLASEGASGRNRIAGAGESEAVGVPRAVLQTPFEESNAEVSPDSRWLAYQSNESGRDEVYVRPFPDVARGRWQVSTEGGKMPLWARSGNELFYRLLDGAVVAVSVERGTGWRNGRPTQVVPPGYFFGGEVVRAYDVSPDGRRFLMIKQNRPEGTAAQYLVLVQNWTEELKRLVPPR
jgi:serine/threonine-protein kinase